MKESVFEKKWFVWVALIFFAPAGIFLLWTNPKFKEYSKNLKIGISCVFMFIFIIAGIGSINDRNREAVNSKQQVKKQEVKKEEPKKEEVKKEEIKPVEQPIHKILNNTKEVKENFNNAAAKLNVDFRINDLEIKEGEKQNTCQYMINDHIGILGTINKKDDTVREIMMIAQGDGTTESAANMIVVAGALIATAEPNISNEERAKLLKDLGIPNEIKKGYDKKIIHNNFKYSASLSDSIGFSFSIGNAQDK